jgi:DNA primase
LFYCFGCKQGGSVFTFHMRRWGVDFKTALVELARKTGVWGIS